MEAVGRIEASESEEGPCALDRAQERMRSRDDGESVEAFPIEVRSGRTRSGDVCKRVLDERSNREAME